MLKIENTEVFGWEAAIRGMRNPMNSWARSDSKFDLLDECGDCIHCSLQFNECPAQQIGPNDLDLMKRLASNGPVHAKYRRMITVYADITAPLYWWKEADTYKVGTVANSCSTMHKIAAKEFTRDDFSHEHLVGNREVCNSNGIIAGSRADDSPVDILDTIIDALNIYRTKYLIALKTEDETSLPAKDIWWQMIQLLPSSYNQKRTVMLNYEVLANIYKWRRNHKLDEWCVHKTPEEHNFRSKDFASGKWGFCDWIESLPYSELITGKIEEP